MARYGKAFKDRAVAQADAARVRDQARHAAVPVGQRGGVLAVLHRGQHAALAAGEGGFAEDVAGNDSPPV